MTDEAWKSLEFIVFLLVAGAIILRMIWPRKNKK